MINYYSEHDTDRAIREKYFPDYSYHGIIVEVGAATPIFLSTTKHFAENGWRAIHVEPNPKFIDQHKSLGNEIYPYACGEVDADEVDFTIVSVNSGNITDHSFSSFQVKEEYQNINKSFFNSLKKEIIKVNSRTLDSIIKEANINHIDVLSIDTEGYEIEVMKGLSLIKPKLIILENVLHLESYNSFMKERGYTLDRKQEHNYFYLCDTAK